MIKLRITSAGCIRGLWTDEVPFAKLGTMQVRRARGRNMKSALDKYLNYMRSVRNASPHTLRSYRNDLGQFLTYLTPPDTATPPLRAITRIS